MNSCHLSNNKKQPNYSKFILFEGLATYWMVKKKNPNEAVKVGPQSPSMAVPSAYSSPAVATRKKNPEPPILLRKPPSKHRTCKVGVRKDRVLVQLTF